MKPIDSDIKNGTYKKVYLLYGNENYVKEFYQKKIIKALVNPEDTFNLNVFDAAEMNMAEVLAQADTMPFFADYRLIVIKNSALTKSGGDELAKYLPSMPESTIMLINEGEVDKKGMNSALFKAVKSLGVLQEENHPREAELTNWILKYLQRNNRVIQRAAMDLLLERTGDDMQNIATELEKLIYYTYGRDSILREDVEAVCSERIEGKVFDLIDLIAARKRQEAIDLFHDLMFLRESPLTVTALISKQFQRMLLIQDLRTQGFDVAAIESKTKIKMFIIRKTLQQTAFFSAPFIRSVIASCGKLEEDVKTGKMDAVMAAELLILSISRQREQRSSS